MNQSNNKIAIVGISGIFPDAKNLNEFYTNLLNKKDSVKSPTVDRLRYTSQDPSLKYKVAGHLDRIDLFDNKFFGISKKEAEFMEPSQRMSLQLACEAIENAGYSLKEFEGSETALYLATNASVAATYRGSIEVKHNEPNPTIHTGSLVSMIFGRIANNLKLMGPAIMVDTGCSSGLVAINEASEKLRSGKVDYALVGGVNLKLNFFPMDGRVGNLGASSPAGKTRAFDADADGIGVGEGGGMLLLKRYNDAVNDKDHIHAVILGAGITQDGGRSNSIAAPSPEAQSKAISKAWEEARINPESIEYIETHGAGTPLGDMIEVQALTDAFKAYTDRKNFCALSAAKSNIGHLGNLAGITGVVKAVQSLKHKKILPTINFKKLNPYIDLDNSAAYIATDALDWTAKEDPRRCGVSCFGLSGTNAHLVLEEAPERTEESSELSPYVLKISAKTQFALTNYIDKIHGYLQETDENLASVLYTLNSGRSDYGYRLMIHANDKNGLLKELDSLANSTFPRIKKSKKAVLLFSSIPVIDDVMLDIAAFSGKKINPNSYNKIALTVLVQYGLYKKLKTAGVDILTVIGTGAGKLTSKIISNQTTLEEALIKANNEEVSTDPINETSLKNVVAKLASKDDLVFVESAPSAGISDTIINLEDISVSNFEVMHFFNGLDEVFQKKFSNLYERGVGIDWRIFYLGNEQAKVEVPTYPFEQSRCWYEPPVELDAIRIKNSLYQTTWDVSQENNSYRETSGKTFMVIVDEFGLAEEISKLLSQQKNTCVLVRLSDKFHALSSSELEVDLNNQDSLKELEEHLYASNVFIDGIISLINFSDIAELDLENYEVLLEKYFFTQYNLLKAFNKELTEGKFSYTVATTLAFKISKNQKQLSALNRLISTLVKNVIIDFPQVKVTHVDFDRTEIEDNAEVLLKEMQQEDHLRIIGYRNGQRFTPSFSNNIELSAKRYGDGFLHKREGTYLITGGSSGIGYEVSKTIAGLGKCNIIIIGKTKLPPKDDWTKVVKKKTAYSKQLRDKVQGLLNLEDLHATVDYYEVDMGDVTEVSNTMAIIREKYTVLDGVVHSAGMGNKGSSIEELKNDYFKGVFGPKIGGTLALEKGLRIYNPDFFLMFSSIGTVVPSKGSIAYSCANTFLDAFALIKENATTNFVTINWSDWIETGLVYRKNLNRSEEEKAVRSETLQGITNFEGISVINYALSLRLPQIAVLKADLSGFRINPFFSIDAEKDMEKEEVILDTSENGSAEQIESSESLFKEEYSEMERQIVKVWNAVLKLDSIDLDDDFYEIGGHSLNMTQMLNGIERDTGITVPIAELLENSTVRSLSKRVEVLVAEGDTPSKTKIVPAAIKPHYRLSNAQKRFWILNQLENKEAYNVPCVFKFKGNVNLEALQTAFQRLIARHEGLRTSFEVVNGEPVQKIIDETSLNFELVLNKNLKEGKIHNDVTAFLAKPFDLTKPPLLRVTVLEKNPYEYIFAMTIPHIVADGRSVFILRNEVLQMYNGIIENKEVSFEPLEIQYKDFAEWQYNKLEENVYQESKAYWMQRLPKTIGENLVMPKNLAPNHESDFSAGQYEFVFNETQSMGLKQIAKEYSTTLFVVVMSIFKTLLHKISNSPVVTLGSPVSERTEQINNQIGAFLNTVVLTSIIEEGDSFETFLLRNKKNTMTDLQHSKFPYDILVSEVLKQKRGEAKDLFEIGFTWNRKEKIEEANDIDFEIESYPFELTKAKKDLWLIISESENGLWGDFIYRKSIYKEGTIQILVERLKILTDLVLKNHKTKIATYDLSIDVERELEKEVQRESFDFNFLD